MGERWGKGQSLLINGAPKAVSSTSSAHLYGEVAEISREAAVSRGHGAPFRKRSVIESFTGNEKTGPADTVNPSHRDSFGRLKSQLL